jgi:hypothetical protein
MSCSPSHCFTAYSYSGMHKSSTPDRVRWCILFLYTQCWTCFVSPFWRLEFWGGSLILGQMCARRPILYVFIRLLLVLYPTFPTPSFVIPASFFTPMPSDLSGLKHSNVAHSSVYILRVYVAVLFCCLLSLYRCIPFLIQIAERAVSCL